jgi:hypothetical protein
MAAAFPAEHHATMASALATSNTEAVREAVLGFAFSPDPAVSSAALVAVSRSTCTLPSPVVKRWNLGKLM